MIGKTSLGAAAALFCLSTTASAQIDLYINPSPNPSTTVDFDNPPATLGPIASNDMYFTMQGVASVDVLGTWTAAGDVLSTNVFGQSLTITGGALTVSQLNDPMDNPAAGAGVDIRLNQAWDEIGVFPTDQTGFTFEAELFNGMTSLGTVQGQFPANTTGVYFRGSMKADRLVFTDVNGGGGWGIDDIRFGDGPPPGGMVPDECVETFFQGGNQGNTDGAVYFDLDAVQPTNITSLQMHYLAAVGTPVGLEVYTTNGSSAGVEGDPNAWTLAALDNGAGISEGFLGRTEIVLATPVPISAGTTGIALVAIGSQHSYTNGTGANQVHTSGDGNLTLTAGTATNVPFTAPVFSPRVWNGRLCTDGTGTIGSNYCMAVANSTGSAASISAAGSIFAADNDLTLNAEGIPAMQFGIFLTSETQASTSVASGILCVGGNIIRFQGPGQILQANASGEYSLGIDISALPAGVPTPIVAGDTYNFTTWFRDIDPMVGNTANFSNGVSITFQ